MSPIVNLGIVYEEQCVSESPFSDGKDGAAAEIIHAS